METTADADTAMRLGAAIGESYPSVSLVYLVGSRLTGDARADSDFDLIVVGELRADWRLEMLPSGQWMAPDDAEDRFGSLLPEVDYEADVFLFDDAETDLVSFTLFTHEARLVWSRHRPRTVDPRDTWKEADNG